MVSTKGINVLHRFFVFVVNAIVLFIICYLVINDGSDKSPIIFMVFYPLLLLMNLIVGVVLYCFKRPSYNLYMRIVVWGLALLLPLLILSSSM
jgi:hypothetical protein